MRLLIPLLIVLLGIGLGGGAGFLLAPPPPEPAECDCAAADAEGHDAEPAPGDIAPTELSPEHEYVDMQNQFVVPVIENDQMTGLLLLSLSLEVDPGAREAVLSKQPKLRDEFLRVLFAYASLGGFGGSYVEFSDLNVIRNDLGAAARAVLGPVVHQVLIVDMIRQDN
ncbi:flagellar basal body-associated protein FliL [Mangrovicoccus algicola]|uniref:Flagellar basal body-associated protein FliL n=1 Tax=Mangrovicoccus algicola TaxID=2771008 RepID=A0A8J6Z0D4_9RHOB|nr:flagellar basal body-associated protein FliL [Mangrovicoccus algicola]MBE3640219.1 flagellar basal body-associated protein FliL [Mangrovicoccus algicola]